MDEGDMTKEQQILIRLLGLNDTDRSWLAIFSEIASLLDSLVMDCDGNQLTQSDFDAVMSSLAATRDKARCHGVLASGSSVIDQETFDGIMRGVGDVIENASEELEDAIGRNAKCVVECAKRDDEIASLKAELANHTWRPVSEYDGRRSEYVILTTGVSRTVEVGIRDKHGVWHHCDARPIKEHPTHFAHLPMDPK